MVTAMKILSSIIALDMRYPFWGMAPHHWVMGNDSKTTWEFKKHHWIS
jgi:hypothetical protein